jgi:hypothetical protein
LFAFAFVLQELNLNFKSNYLGTARHFAFSCQTIQFAMKILLIFLLLVSAVMAALVVPEPMWMEYKVK